jgi:hypothetical protein
MSSADLERQAKVIGEKVKIDDLKDPVKRQEFIARFLILHDAGNASSVDNAGVSLLGGASGLIGQQTLLSIQSLRRG